MLKKIVDLLGWVGFALVLAGVVVRFVRPDLVELRNSLLIAGLACTLAYMLTQWREIARAFSRRQARYGTLTAGSIIAVLGILVGINYLATRHNTRWDLTAASQFTISDQTRRILEGLAEPVQIRVFAREDQFRDFRDRLSGYEHASRQVRVEYIDIDRNPARTRQYDVQTYGTIVFEYGDRIERTTSRSEQDLTNALIKVTQGEQQKVYFIQGHGEKDPTSADRDGYDSVAGALGSDNFQVETLVLAQETEVPADAAVVVIAGPQTDYLPGEIEMLRAWLNRGGKALVLLDPPETADRPHLPNLKALLSDWAIEVGHDVVVDASGVGQLIGTDATVPVAASYPAHPITDRFGLLTAYPLARSVSPIAGGVGDRFAQSFIETSPRSWAESDIEGLMRTGEVSLDEDQGDRRGPISIGAAVNAPAPDPPAADAADEAGADGNADPRPARTPETRVVVVGDSNFAANFAIGIQGNRDMFLNMVSWLAQQEDLIAIRPREAEDRRLTLTADQERRIFWLSIVIIPGVILMAGVHAWWRRR